MSCWGVWQKITAIGELPQARLEKDLLAQQEMRQLDKKLKDSRKANASAVSRRGWERMGTDGNEEWWDRRTFIILYIFNVNDCDCYVDCHFWLS